MIHHRLSVCCLKKGCIHEYILYVSYISYHRLLLEKKDVYVSISFIYNISFIIVFLLLEQRDVYMIITFICDISFIIVPLSVA